MFIAFRVPYSPAIGVKLIATPWTDAHLQNLDGITVEQLRQEHLSKGMPADLMRVLHLAANADVRILIFDADAHQIRWHALGQRSEEHTSELQSLMRSSYAVFCLKKKKIH